MNASVILEDAERMIGWDLTQLETRQEQMARQAFSLALQEVWESWWWADLMKCEPLPAAQVYDAGTTYTAPAFVYFPATKKFYQAMQPTTGNAPAVLINGSYATNYQYWAEASQRPAGGDYDPATTYILGDPARSPVDGNFYSLFNNLMPLVQAFTITGFGDAGFNTTYRLTASFTDAQGFKIEPAYVSGDGHIIGQQTSSDAHSLSSPGYWYAYTDAGAMPTYNASAPGMGTWFDSTWADIPYNPPPPGGGHEP